MHRVVRRVINHKYTDIKADVLKENTIIDFDCYIKRFDDYVIIIEAGTLISAELLKKVLQHKVIYILKHDMEKADNYIRLHSEDNDAPLSLLSDEDIINSALFLSKRVSDISTVEERLETVYTTSAHLLSYLFDKKNETIPLEALTECVKEIVRSVDVPINIMPILIKMLPEHYTTHHHSVNVAFFSAIIGKYADIAEDKLMNLAYAGLLHDIGKMKVNEDILVKPEKLEDDEFETVKQHAQFGYEILRRNKITDTDILNGVLYHHEKLDGTGYPRALRGKIIPKFARIIGLCDVFDALTTRRTYRHNYSSYEALLLIKQEMREQFDELYTDTFIRLLTR